MDKIQRTIKNFCIDTFVLGALIILGGIGNIATFILLKLEHSTIAYSYLILPIIILGVGVYFIFLGKKLRKNRADLPQALELVKNILALSSILFFISVVGAIQSGKSAGIISPFLIIFIILAFAAKAKIQKILEPKENATAK